MFVMVLVLVLMLPLSWLCWYWYVGVVVLVSVVVLALVCFGLVSFVVGVAIRVIQIVIILQTRISRRGHRNHELGAEFDDSDVHSDQFNSQATQVLILKQELAT